jgi:hypothetical protein
VVDVKVDVQGEEVKEGGELPPISGRKSGPARSTLDDFNHQNIENGPVDE